MLTDQVTLSRLVGTLAADIVKVGVATSASILMATVAGATTLAVGPILAVVVVGFGVTYLLEKVDNSLGITDRVVAGLDELGNDVQRHVVFIKKQVGNVADQVADRVIEYAVESVENVTINWAGNRLDDYLSLLPRVR